jgi:chromosome segregation ATPase
MEKICNVCPELQILSVRCMMSGERTKVKTYPDESQILFKVEKITGALDFLDSLNKVASIIDEIRPYINQLREMNYSLCPEITNAMSKIAKHIEQEECSIKSLKKTQSAMIKKMAPYEEEIEKLKKDSKKGKNFDMSTYENTHVEYRKAKSEKRELDSQINKHENTLGDYQSFYRILENSVKKINGLRVAV